MPKTDCCKTHGLFSTAGLRALKNVNSIILTIEIVRNGTFFARGGGFDFLRHADQFAGTAFSAGVGAFGFWGRADVVDRAMDVAGFGG